MVVKELNDGTGGVVKWGSRGILALVWGNAGLIGWWRIIGWGWNIGLGWLIIRYWNWFVKLLRYLKPE